MPESLDDVFPHSLAWSFSRTVQRLQVGARVTITSSSKNSIEEVLKWMMVCGKGGKFEKFLPKVTYQQKLHYLEIAELLDIPILIKSLNTRIKDAPESQLPAVDVRYIFTNYTADDPIREGIITVIATLFHEKKALTDRPNLVKFRGENK
jgi:hypothetical protein